MKTKALNILKNFQRRWQWRLWLEVFLYSLAAAVFFYSVSRKFWVAALVFGVCAGILISFKKPWILTLNKVTSFLDQKLEKLEFSSGLLLKDPRDLSGLAQLQQQKVAREILENKEKLQPPTGLKRAFLISTLILLLSCAAFYFNFSNDIFHKKEFTSEEEKLEFKALDSVSRHNTPVLENQELHIVFPSYTGLASQRTENMDIKAVEGSRVRWKLSFSGEVDSVFLESTGRKIALAKNENEFSGAMNLKNSGFYSFKFKDKAGGEYVSKLHSIEVVPDRAPEIEIEGLKQFVSFNFDDEKQIAFSARLSDDFGLDNAQIIATVSRGRGESVKFREEKLEFDNELQKGSKNQVLRKQFDLDQLQMQPGDELYFYVEASDLRRPQPNIARSETYFASIRDTVDYGPGVEGGLGVDLMPDYFRSQRQLIIDTEKLISQRGRIPQKEFNDISNDLGFDQKALRLKYGQFMGDEAEGGLANTGNSQQNSEDPLSEYTHDHDGDNEHNLVEQHDHEHEEEASDNEETDPLEEYLHDHGDPESSTLFADNLKAKLRQALDIMWDAELHLRLHEPENSLPFQYKALALIQEIKNSARIYVHRIGFDPPPIREEARLSGDISEVTNFQKSETRAKEEKFARLRNGIARLETLKQKAAVSISEADSRLFEQAGQELAEIAVNEPGKHLETLQALKFLSDSREIDPALAESLQLGLLKALPKPEAKPGRIQAARGNLDKLLMQELEKND